VEIKTGVICNTAAVIEHEVKIGEYTFVGPNATLLGAVEVGSFSFIGANSVIKQGVKIGNNVTIGAGTVVLRDIANNQTVVGNPQRVIKS
jgi:acetyltransferase-like isoleucine patch superfamily enzyme